MDRFAERFTTFAHRYLSEFFTGKLRKTILKPASHATQERTKMEGIFMPPVTEPTRNVTTLLQYMRYPSKSELFNRCCRGMIRKILGIGYSLVFSLFAQPIRFKTILSLLV